MPRYNRAKLVLGSKVQVKNLRTGSTTNGVPYWAFDFLFYDNSTGKRLSYKRITLMSREKCWVKEGDWLMIQLIKEYITKTTRNRFGGIDIYETLVCDFIKSEKETEYDNDI